MTTPTKDPVRVARSRVAHATKKGDSVALHEARINLTDAKLERAIQEALAAAPPLTEERRQRLAALLLAGGAK